MDEDEECLHENSSLNLYLQNLGFSDVQLSKNEGVIPTTKFRISRAKSNFVDEVIDKDVLDQIEIITSKKLLFEEDILIVEILLSNFKVGNNGLLKLMFQDLFGFVIIFLSLCLYFAIGYYILVVISPFYAYKCADYFRRKSFVKVKIKRLMTVLKKNSCLLRRSVDLIKAQKNRCLLLQDNNTDLSSHENNVDFYFHLKFKSDFLSILNKMTNILVNSTQKLIKKVRLIDYADTPEFYLCNNFEKNFESDDPFKVYLLYLLVQSEFLRRIILSLIPNLNLSQKNNNFNNLKNILEETVVNLTKVQKSLEHKFDLAINIGLKCEYNFNLSKAAPCNEFTEEFISNIHDISNIIIGLLLKCKNIEESITMDKLPDCVEANLIELQTGINYCQKNIKDSFILLKKANAISDGVKQEMVQKEESAPNDSKNNNQSSSVEKSYVESDNKKQGVVKLQEKEIEITNSNLNKIEVGFTDFDSLVEDDVFEAYVKNENHNTELNNMDEWDLDEVLKKKLKTEFSQNVMKELKGRLVEKAKNWKKREMNILRKKGLLDYNEEFFDDNEEVENEIDPEEKIKETCDDEISLEKAQTHTFEDKLCIKTSDGDLSVSDDQLDTPSPYCFGNLKKEFLKDLSERRKLIFTTPIVEEEFCLGSTHEEPFQGDITE